MKRLIPFLIGLAIGGMSTLVVHIHDTAPYEGDAYMSVTPTAASAKYVVIEMPKGHPLAHITLDKAAAGDIADLLKKP